MSEESTRAAASDYFSPLRLLATLTGFAFALVLAFLFRAAIGAWVFGS